MAGEFGPPAWTRDVWGAAGNGDADDWGTGNGDAGHGDADDGYHWDEDDEYGAGEQDAETYEDDDDVGGVGGGDAGGRGHGGDDDSANEDEDEDEDAMPRALPVAEYDDAAIEARIRAGPPTSAEDYLTRVRYEARRIPPVVTAAQRETADVGAAKGTDSTGGQHGHGTVERAADTDLHRDRPADGWARTLLADFADLRQVIAMWDARAGPDVAAAKYEHPVPPVSSHDAWRALCFNSGRGAGVEPLSGSSADPSVAGNYLALPKGPLPPLVSLLLQLDDVASAELLTVHVRWALSDHEGGRPLTRDRALWLYGLMARLSKPVPADVASALRRLCEACQAQRATALDGGEPVAHWDTLIVLVTHFFGQHDIVSPSC